MLTHIHFTKMKFAWITLVMTFASNLNNSASPKIDAFHLWSKLQKCVNLWRQSLTVFSKFFGPKNDILKKSGHEYFLATVRNITDSVNKCIFTRFKKYLQPPINVKNYVRNLTLTLTVLFGIARAVSCLLLHNIIIWLQMEITIDCLLLWVWWRCPFRTKTKCPHLEFNCFSEQSLFNI